MQPLLEVTDFAVGRGPGFHAALPSLRLLPGEVAALYGPSGCGKTTVLQALLGTAPKDVEVTGAVNFAGVDPTRLEAADRRRLLREDVILLAQDAHAALDPLQPVGRQIEQATGSTTKAAIEALRKLGVAEAATLVRRCPHQVSGGQAQRVLLAMALLRRPALIVADEPSASLDGGSYGELIAHLRWLLKRDSAVLMATHDHRLLRDLDASVHGLEGGRFLPCELDEVAWPERENGHGIGKAAVLEARDIKVAFGDRVVLDGADFAIARGEVVAVVGESGAGKTTLVRVLADHLQPARGFVERPSRIGAVQLCCQDALGSMTPGRTLRSLLAEASNPFFDVEVASRDLHVERAILERDPIGMSGGERRRAVLLRALAVHPDVLLLDEPTASLDREAAVAVLRSLLALQKSRGLAVVLVTHDLELARAVAHRVVAVEAGVVVPC